MRKIITLTIAFLTVIYSFGQPVMERHIIPVNNKGHQFLSGKHKIHAVNNYCGTRNVLKNYTATALRLDSMIFLELSPDSTHFDKSMKESYLYDNTGKNISLIQYLWEEMTGRFVPQIKDDYQYDANNNLISMIEYEWGGPWINLQKDEYAYDAKGNEISYIISFWNDIDNKWEIDSKSETTYFPNGKMKDNISYSSGSGTLQNSLKSEYSYDGSSHLTEKKNFVWDIDSSKWFAYEKEQYYCDANGNDTAIVGSQIDKPDTVTNLSWKWTYSYNLNGKMTGYKEYFWDLSNTWYGSYKFELSYNNVDGSGSALSEFIFDDIAEKWIGITNRSYIYDSLYTGSKPVFPLYFYDEDDIGFYTNNKPMQIIDNYIDADTVTWIATSKKNLYYSDFTKLKTNVTSSNDVSVYPNPASDIINFTQKVNRAEIISVTGAVVKSATNSEQMDVSGLPQGLYIIRADDIVIGKLIKE
jgi:hypothetical protein